MPIFRIPLTEACTVEVLGRVAYRVVVRAWRNGPARHVNREVSLWLVQLAVRTREEGFPALYPILYSFSIAVGYGMPLAHYLALYCAEARQGRIIDVRRAVYPGYKANRNPTPRVTNRGGQTVNVWLDPGNNATLPDDLARGDDDGN